MYFVCWIIHTANSTETIWKRRFVILTKNNAHEEERWRWLFVIEFVTQTKNILGKKFWNLTWLDETSNVYDDDDDDDD